MQITETNASGLKREYKVVIPAAEIQNRIEGRLQQIAKNLRLPGFRPGKAPMPMVRQRYGQSVMGEVLESAVNDTSAKAISEHGLRPALQPRIQVTQFAEDKDLEYTMAVEVLPEVEPGDFADLELERLTAEAPQERVDEALERIASSRRKTEKVEEDRPAKDGDVVLIDFAGTVGGVAREGMQGEDFELELGSGSFVDTFEKQLVGAKAGDHRTVTVTFPAGYHAAELAGEEAVFEVDVKEIRQPVAPKIDDAFAKELGFDDLDGLKNAVREQIQAEYAGLSRSKLKRALLDKLAETHRFDVPEGMVDAEFDMIWRRLQDELKRSGGEMDEAGKSEDELKAEYRAIAERRVRLGLLLAEVGRRSDVKVTQDELNRAVIAEARRWPGQEMQVFDFFKKNPQAVENLRAPIFEDKVVDHILTLAKVADRAVSPEELARDPDEEASAEEKPAKKAKKAKAEAKPAEAEGEEKPKPKAKAMKKKAEEA